MIEGIERDLDTLRALAERTDDDEVRLAVEHVLRYLQPDQMVTTSEAARLLGIRSINTVKALILSQQIPHTRVGNRMTIPLSEVLRLKASKWVPYLKASDRAHEEVGGDALTQEEMDSLSAERPGTLPWKRQR
jgi:excisionase family DNA binding protein